MKKNIPFLVSIILIILLLSCYSIARVNDAGSSFIIGDDNSDEAIVNMKKLTGLTIKEIEQRARPCRYTNYENCSDKGFLGKDEKFIERLLIDNRYVHGKGLTHQRVAKPLFIMKKMDAKYCTSVPSKIGPSAKCMYNGGEYYVLILCTKGIQESIFNDSLRTSCLVSVDKLVNGKSVKKLVYDSDLLPNYIKLYGFYEGDTPFRVPPEKIISFFNLLK